MVEGFARLFVFLDRCLSGSRKGFFRCFARGFCGLDIDLVRTLADVQRAIDGGAKTPILDARAAPRFKGEAPEPRAGLRSGHMLGALNVPFGALLNADGTMKSADELKQIFDTAGLKGNAAPICSCGSDITAAVIALALARTDRWDAAVYDGLLGRMGRPSRHKGRHRLKLATPA